MERDPPICNLGTHLATVDLSPGNLHQYPERELSEWFVALLNSFFTSYIMTRTTNILMRWCLLCTNMLSLDFIVQALWNNSKG